MKRHDELIVEEFIVKPSRWIVNGTICIGGFAFLIWMLNETGVFMIDTFLMRIEILVCAIAILTSSNFARREVCALIPQSRYIIITCALIVVIMMNQLLPLWTGVFMTLPVVFAGLYCNKKLLITTFVVQLIVALVEPVISVIIGVLPAEVIECLITYMKTHAISTSTMSIAGKAVLCVGVPNAIVLCIVFFIVYQRVDYQRENIENKIAMTLSREHDIITGLNNRLSLNMRMDNTGYVFPNESTFIYVDARDIENVNRRLGVAECDRMLIEIANMLRELYGDDATYRLSASVFAVIIERPVDDAISMDIEDLRSRLNDVALACAIGIIEVSQGTDFNDVIIELEKRRSADRVNYYGSSRNDRRRR